MRAAGLPLISTDDEPLEIMPGAPGEQPGNMHGKVCEAWTAAGKLLNITLGEQFNVIVIGMGGCAIGTVG